MEDYYYKLIFYTYKNKKLKYHSSMGHNGGYGINTRRIENGIAYLNTANNELHSLCDWDYEVLTNTNCYLFFKKNEKSIILKPHNNKIVIAKKEMEICKGIVDIYSYRLESLNTDDYMELFLTKGLDGVFDKIKSKVNRFTNLIKDPH